MLDKITRDEGRYKKIDQRRDPNKPISTYSQWSLGEKNDMKYLDSVSHFLHDKKPNIYEKQVREYGNASHFGIEMDKEKFKYQDIKTETSRNYNLRKPPLTNKHQAFNGRKGNIQLGNDKVSYNTTYTDDNRSLKNDYDKISYKREERNFNIITNNEEPKEKLKKAAGFDCHNPYQTRLRISHDRPQLQAGYNIITWNNQN